MATQRHNIFLALKLDPEAVACIVIMMDWLRRERGFVGKLTRLDCLHISLLSLGDHKDLPYATIDRATAALAAVTMSCFAIALNHLGSWKGRPGQNPLVLVGDDGVIGVDLLLAQIHPALVRAGFALPRLGQRIPHVTLAYGGQQVPEEVVAPVQWTVREFVLIDSLVGEGRHVVLNRWPLTSADAALSGTPPSP